MVNKCPLTRKESDFFNKIKKYSIREGAYNVYTHDVKGNKGLSKEECRKKIIRNSVLGFKWNIRDIDGKIVKSKSYYGNLAISLDHIKKEIKYIENRVGTFGYTCDADKKQYLEEKLGLIHINNKELKNNVIHIKNEDNIKAIKPNFIKKVFGMFGKSEVAE